MGKLFSIVRGNSVPNLEGIAEGFSIVSSGNSYQFTINVSAENIDNVFKSLCGKVRTPGFLLLEHGTNRNIEKQLRKSDSNPFHKDVYYLDGLDWESFLDLYIEYSELLVHDGGINLGFGSHSGLDEVFVGPYKIFTIFTDEVEKYIEVLTSLDLPRVEKIKTVLQNFTKDSPGGRMTIKHNDIGIHEMVEKLSKRGMYLAERRED